MVCRVGVGGRQAGWWSVRCVVVYSVGDEMSKLAKKIFALDADWPATPGLAAAWHSWDCGSPRALTLGQVAISLLNHVRFLRSASDIGGDGWMTSSELSHSFFYFFYVFSFNLARFR